MPFLVSYTLKTCEVIKDVAASCGVLHPRGNKSEIDYARSLLLLDAENECDSLEEMGGEMARWGVLTGDPSNYLNSLARMKEIEPGRVNGLVPEILNLDNLSFHLMTPKK